MSSGATVYCRHEPSLTYLNNRYYDPATGVFTSVDPLVGKTGTPYLYAGGNPTTLSDPSGLSPEDACFEFASYGGCLRSRADQAGQSVLAETAAELSGLTKTIDSDPYFSGDWTRWVGYCAGVWNSCMSRSGQRPEGFGFDSLDNQLLQVARLSLMLMMMTGAMERTGIATVDYTGVSGDWRGRLGIEVDADGSTTVGVGYYLDSPRRPSGWIGLIADIAGVVALGCWAAAIPTGGATLACAGPASTVAAVAGAAELVDLYASGDDSFNCKAGMYAIGIFLPGGDTADLATTPLGVVHELFGLGGGAAC